MTRTDRPAEAIIRGFFNALSQRDYDYIDRIYAPGAYYEIEGGVADPRMVTKDKLHKVLAHVLDQFPRGVEFTVKTVLVDEQMETAAAEVEALGEHRDGALLNSRYLFVFYFKDGLIERMQEFIANDSTRRLISEEFWGSV